MVPLLLFVPSGAGFRHQHLVSIVRNLNLYFLNYNSYFVTFNIHIKYLVTMDCGGGHLSLLNNYDSSDELLLEAGFLALLVAPLLPGRRKGSKGSPSDSISLWLVRWLLFRFLLTCGLSKLISGCPKWWGLTAFDYYFESMPLPSPLAWYFHHTPSWQLRLYAVFANVCEMGFSFLFFIPLRSVRITGFVIQVNNPQNQIKF